MAEEKHYSADGTHVLVYNAETDARWECPEGHLPIALKLGWELAEPVDEADEDPTGFDPGNHTVAEVNDYLTEYADDADEVARVLALESEGKDRKSVTSDPNPGD